MSSSAIGHRRTFGRFPVFYLLGLLEIASGCGLTRPEARHQYILTGVNGQAVPMTLDSGTVDGLPFAYRILGGRLTLFESGHFAWELTGVTLINGSVDTRFPERMGRVVGDYIRRDTIYELSYLFKASWQVQTGTLRVRDVSGLYEGATYEMTAP